MIWIYLGYVFGGGCVFVAALVIARFRQGASIGAKLTPMSPHDRLRVVLIIRLVEEAEGELLKAAWDGKHERGHPAIGDLLFQLHEVRDLARKYLREH